MLVLVARSVAGNYVVDNLVKTESVRPAASDTWDILTALLRDGARTLLGVGIVLLVGVWLVGPGARATALRARLAPWLERPEIAYGAAALALVLLVWWGPTEQTRRWQVIARCSRCCSASASPRWPERRERTRTPWAVQATLPRHCRRRPERRSDRDLTGDAGAATG